MNDSQKEVLKYQLEHEKKTLKELKQVYQKAINDTKEKIEMLSARIDLENIQSIVYQKKYQETIKKQLEDILDNLNKNQYDTIDKYLNDCYYNGYVGAMYDLHSQGIPLIMPLNQEEITRALQIDTKLSKPLYEHLNEDTDLLKNRIRANISRGIANGESWNETAIKIAKGMNSPFNRAINNAIRIVRTEGHRIQVASSLNAMKDAKKEGADIVKQWCSTLDNKTRPLHQQLDGKIAELDKKFVIGVTEVEAPGHFGLASQDCNCRCCLLQRAKWALDEDELEKLKDRAKFYGIDKSEDFQEFKEKYIENTEQLDAMSKRKLFVIPDNGKRISGKKISDSELNIYMSNIKNRNIKRTYNKTIDFIRKSDVKPDKIVYTTFEKLKGYAGYDKNTRTLYISDIYGDDQKFKKLLEKNYFAGKTVEEMIRHELTHVKYRDKIHSLMLKTNKKEDTIIQEIEADLRKYILDQITIDNNYLIKIVSSYAKNTFESSKQLSEVIAEVEAKHNCQDKELVKLVREVLS